MFLAATSLLRQDNVYIQLGYSGANELKVNLNSFLYLTMFTAKNVYFTQSL